MRLYSAKRSLLLIATLAAFAGKSQTSSFSNPNSLRENNPYSKYGIGELWNGNTTALKAMGNISSAWAEPYLINTDNPASYASLRLTTFEGGLLGSQRNITAADVLSYSTGTASLGYLALAIPFNKRGAISFGLRPYARSYYSLVDTIFGSSVGSVLRSYRGDGGLSYAYFGGAYKYKGLSLGFNFGYLFGTYQNNTTLLGIDPLTTNRIYESAFARYNAVGGVHWKGGALYEHKLRDSAYSVRFGATFTLGQNLNERTSYFKTSRYNFRDTIVNDTVFKQRDQNYKMTLPASFSAGVHFSKIDKWTFGIDFTTTAWASFKSRGDTAMNQDIADRSYKLSIGGQLTPNLADRSYLARVTYRVGAYYGTDYLRINNTLLPCYGFTFGGSLPYRRNVRTTARIHLSFDIGRLGTTSNNLMQQNYVRFGLGMSFNEKWFIPRKYD